MPTAGPHSLAALGVRPSKYGMRTTAGSKDPHDLAQTSEPPRGP